MTLGELLAKLATFASEYPEKLGNDVKVAGNGPDSWPLESLSISYYEGATLHVSASLVEDNAKLNTISDLECEVMELREELARANRLIASLEEIPTSTNNPIPVMDQQGAVQ